MSRRGAGSLLVLLMLATACGGAKLETDPLAPIPTEVDKQEIKPPQVRVEWKRNPQASTLIELSSDPDEEPFPAATQAPAIDAKHVYTVYGQLLRALALADGHLQWELETAAPIVLPPLPIAAGLALATADGRWLWVDTDGVLRAAADPGPRPQYAAVVGRGVVSVDGSSASLIEPSGSDAAAVRWRTELAGAAWITAAPDAGVAVVVTAQGALIGLALADGHEMWRSERAPAIGARVAVDSRNAYVAGRDNRLRALRLRDGKQAWIGKQTGVRVVGAPAVAGGVVWIAGLDAALHGFDSHTGSHLHRVQIAGRSFIDLVTWGPWVIASPEYGPWTILRAPLFDNGPSDPGQPLAYTVSADDDLVLAPGTGTLGIVALDASGTVRLLRPPPQPPQPLAEESR